MYQRQKPIHGDYLSIMGRVRGGDVSRHNSNAIGSRIVRVNPANQMGPKKRLLVANPGAQTGTQKTVGAPYPDNLPGQGIFSRHDIKAR